MDEKQLALAAVAMRTAIKYRKNWNKNSPTVKLMQALMPTAPGARKGYRLYMDMHTRAHRHYSIPPAVRSALQRAGFVATDYLAKKCVKLSDKEQRNEFNIGKVIAKDSLAKAAFDNDPQLQNSNTISHQVVFSCHPYDVIGMSTGRAWDKQSCMRLDDGKVNRGDAGRYHNHVKNDVADGTIVAYAIASDDTNIKHPKCRILIKPYRDDKGNILFHEESSIYGNPVAGFRAVVRRFLKMINAEVPSGAFRMAKGLYEDGAPTHVEHRKGSENNNDITWAEVTRDLELVEPFIAQQLRATEDSEYSSSVIIDLLNRIVNDAKEVGELHDTQIKAIADMLRGNEVQKTEFQTYALEATHPNQVVIEIGRLAGFYDEELPNLKVPTKMLKRMAIRGGKNLSDMWQKLASDDHWEEEDQVLADTLESLMAGVIQLPSKEDMEKEPELRAGVFTMASAFRFLPLFGITKFEKGTYKILDRYAEDFPEQQKELTDSVFDLVRRIGGDPAALAMVLDNDERLSPDLFYYTEPHEATRYMVSRRLFRAFQRLKNPQTSRYIEELSINILKSSLTLHPADAMKFKQVMPDVYAVLRADPELLHNLGPVGAAAVTQLAKDAPDLLMHYDVASFAIGDKLGDTLEGLVSAFAEYKGEKLTPQTMSMEYLVQASIFVDNMLPRPNRIHAKFELDREWTAQDIEQRYTTYSARPWHLTRPFSYYACKGTVNGQRADLTNNRDLMLQEGPDSFESIHHEDFAAAVRPLMKTAQMYPMAMQCSHAVSYLVHGLDYEELPELDQVIDDFVNNSGGVWFEHQDKENDYNAFRDSFRDEAWEVIEKARRRNERRLEALSIVIERIGEPGDEEQAREFLSHYDNDTEAEFETAVQNLLETQEAAQETYHNIQNYIEENE